MSWTLSSAADKSLQQHGGKHSVPQNVNVVVQLHGTGEVELLSTGDVGRRLPKDVQMYCHRSHPQSLSCLSHFNWEGGSTALNHIHITSK